MDSTLKPLASKLPIKRKTQNPTITTPTTDTYTNHTIDLDTMKVKPPAAAPAFKFHRIWTEPDEIRFLRGLLEADNLSFPRDLSLFYDQFSQSMSQPYTKSQLSEKLRRLRKKFRVTSSRISRGFDLSLLSSHDRSLFDLSHELWGPQFNANNNGDGGENVHLVGCLAAESVLNLFDECSKEVKMDFLKQKGVIRSDADMGFQRRWRELRVAEFDLLASRLSIICWVLTPSTVCLLGSYRWSVSLSSANP
ncbi:DUF573 domain-containing protein, partial [Cephalotus follicularis]